MVSAVVLAVLTSCGNNNSADKFIKAAPGDSSYTVKGHVKGLDSGWAFLYNAQNPSGQILQNLTKEILNLKVLFLSLNLQCLVL